MIDLEQAAEPAAGPRRSRRRLWAVLASVAVLVIGGGVTAVAVSFHYLHAPALVAGGSAGWLPPDNRATHVVQARSYSVMVVPARPNHWQTFSVQVENPSSVTQTILGLAFSQDRIAEPERLAVSTTSTALGDEMAAQYTSRPVAIPPNGIRTVRLSLYAAGCDIWGRTGRRMSITALTLRVRVGAFTRTEQLGFGHVMFQWRGTGDAC